MTLTSPVFAIACVVIALAATLTATVIAVSYKPGVFSSSAARSFHSLAAAVNEAMCSLLALSVPSLLLLARGGWLAKPNTLHECPHHRNTY